MAPNKEGTGGRGGRSTNRKRNSDLGDGPGVPLVVFVCTMHNNRPFFLGIRANLLEDIDMIGEVLVIFLLPLAFTRVVILILAEQRKTSG